MANSSLETEKPSQLETQHDTKPGADACEVVLGHTENRIKQLEDTGARLGGYEASLQEGKT